MRRFDPFVTMFAVTFATMTSVAPIAAKGPKADVQVAKGAMKSPKASGTSTTSGSPKMSGAKAEKAKTAPSGKGKAASDKKPSTTTTSTTTSSTGTPTSSTGTTAPTSEPNAISTKIARNPERKAQLTAMLPQGMTLEQASAGFRNQGQFVAALNASRNENVPFARLKTEMVENNLSLGQAVKYVKNNPEATTPTTPAAPAAPTAPTTPAAPTSPTPTAPTAPTAPTSPASPTTGTTAGAQ